ncbi:hypothetical protein MKEN_00426200 [Mycena kentingensis (nom. inval.)]|nr:hypothetical protein MKEN_00426200 [Mycena kentingensis (nom. inval.)]
MPSTLSTVLRALTSLSQILLVFALLYFPDSERDFTYAAVPKYILGTLLLFPVPKYYINRLPMAFFAFYVACLQPVVQYYRVQSQRPDWTEQSMEEVMHMFNCASAFAVAAFIVAITTFNRLEDLGLEPKTERLVPGIRWSRRSNSDFEHTRLPHGYDLEVQHIQIHVQQHREYKVDLV